MSDATSTGDKTVLVTGASAGIGEAFAKVYAARGYRLVLAARRGDRLEAVAASLRQQYGTTVHVLVADFAAADAPRELTAAVDAGGIRVDVLVNNAGYALPGTYRNTAWDRQAEFLRVMVVAYAELAHRLLPGMIERRWGRIVNVASLAGLVPGSAGHTLYAASKAFLVKFSESLAMEVHRFGVHVTAVCPGYTRSEFHDVAGIRRSMDRLPSFMWMTADVVARQGYEASEAGRVVYVPGTINKTLAGLARAVPSRLTYAVMRRVVGSLRGVRP